MKKQTLFKIILIVAGLAIPAFCFLCVDMALGYRDLMRDREDVSIEGVHTPDPMLGWKLKPGSIGVHETAHYSVRYVIDEDGCKHVPAPADAGMSVHVFGDSYTFGMGVGNEDTFPNIMAEQYLNGSVRFHNHGTMGYGIVQMYVRFLDIHEGLTPGDLVLFTPISYDIMRNYSDFRFVSQFVLDRRMFRCNRFPHLNRKREIVSRRLVTPWNFLKALALRARLTGNLFYALHQRLRPDSLETAEWIFRRIDAMCREKGASFALVFLPQVTERMAGRYHVDISGFEHLDIGAYFPDTKRELQPIKLASRDGHWNRKGHEMAAGALVETLTRHGYFSSEQIKVDVQVNSGG